MSEYLEKQNIIDKAYYCEEDLTGNIDDFMNDRVPDSQLVIFFASEKSVYNSVDCAHELDLARQHNIEIIPVKGANVSWQGLDDIKLSRQLGFEYDEKEFDSFKDKIFKYIKTFKETVDLFEAEGAKYDKQKFGFKNSVERLTEGEEFMEALKANFSEFETAFEEMSYSKISLLDYVLKIAEILSRNRGQ